MKHTPGPWKASDLIDQKIVIEADRHYTHECIHFATVYEMTGDGGKEVAEANANLIAAAPDLLEAAEIGIQLWKIAQQYEGLQHLDCEKISKAIKKAKGE